tara:strand:- start:379 stop:531 length:153 start_codon:yes stop_codon:yes gene_type:complete
LILIRGVVKMKKVVYPNGIRYTIPDDDKTIARIIEHIAGGKAADEFLMVE